MKLASIFLIGSLGLLIAGAADAGEKRSEHRKHAHHEHRHDKKHARHDNKHRRGNAKEYRWDKRHHHASHHSGKHHKYDRHHYRHDKRKHKRHHRDAFVGGLVLGGAIGHAFHNSHDFCPSRRHRHHRDYRYGDYVWSDYEQRCYRAKRGRHGDVFVKVPRRRCY